MSQRSRKKKLGSVFTDGRVAIYVEMKWYDRPKRKWHSDEVEILHKYILKENASFDLWNNLYIVDDIDVLLSIIHEWKTAPTDKYLNDDIREIIIEVLNPVVLCGNEIDVLCGVDFCMKKHVPYSTKTVIGNNKSINDYFSWMDDDINNYIMRNRRKKQKELNEKRGKQNDNL